MKNWLILLLMVAQQSCRPTPGIHSPVSAEYQQQEDTVLLTLCNQVVGETLFVMPYLYFDFPSRHSGPGQGKVYPLPTIALVENMGFPLRLGNLMTDKPFEVQKASATKEAVRIIKAHSINPAFLSLLLGLWNPQDSVNLIKRTVPFEAMEYRLDYPSRLLPTPMHTLLLDTNYEGINYNMFSRVCFDKAFTKAVFQVTYSDPGSGRMTVFCAERQQGKWKIVAQEQSHSVKK
ncbi:hypothetical protein [Hymenobacter lucidus]|uniref:Lipoprotein n=1 Tax=Hymenobacter lucidus TaxID=2880930 RepID=A0ABS8APA9_9BACT|nr:hypothetical protein [Hymenobacter lucidus]MCB2407591.1 hypothetical protein [Hymenobacter lucidus]